MAFPGDTDSARPHGAGNWAAWGTGRPRPGAAVDSAGSQAGVVVPAKDTRGKDK